MCARRPCFAPKVSLPYAQNPAPAFPATPRAGSGHCAQGRKRDPREPDGHAPSNAGRLGSAQSPPRLAHAQSPHGLTPAAASPLLASETLSSSLAYAASRSCAGPQCQSALRAKPSPGFPCDPSKPVLGIARKAEHRDPREPFGRWTSPLRESASGKEKCERHRRHFPRQPHPHFAPKVSLALGGRRFALGLTARPVSLRATARRYTLPTKRQNSAAPATRWTAPPQVRPRSVNGWHEGTAGRNGSRSKYSLRAWRPALLNPAKYKHIVRTKIFVRLTAGTFLRGYLPAAILVSPLRGQ